MRAVGKWLTRLAVLDREEVARSFTPAPDKTDRRGFVSVVSVGPEERAGNFLPAANGDKTAPDEGRFRLAPADADRCHWPPWTEAEIETFVARVATFLRRGMSATDADDLAERLVLRDRDG